jgi:hypothetical protein
MARNIRHAGDPIAGEKRGAVEVDHVAQLADKI